MRSLALPVPPMANGHTLSVQRPRKVQKQHDTWMRRRACTPSVADARVRRHDTGHWASRERRRPSAQSAVLGA